MGDYYDEPKIWWPTDRFVDEAAAWLATRKGTDLPGAMIADWSDAEGPLWGISWDESQPGAASAASIIAELQALFPDVHMELWE